MAKSHLELRKVIAGLLVDMHQQELMGDVQAGLASLDETFSIDEDALDMLVTAGAQYEAVLGAKAQAFAELAGRKEATVPDITRALAHFGEDLDVLTHVAAMCKMQGQLDFLHRDTNEEEEFNFPVPQTVPKVLIDGSIPRAKPAYIPDHLPEFPDAHSYMKTAAYEEILTSYAQWRQRRAASRIEGQLTVIKQGLKTKQVTALPFAYRGTMELSHRDVVCAPPPLLRFLAPLCAADDPEPLKLQSNANAKTNAFVKHLVEDGDDDADDDGDPAKEN
eukprot:m.241326 g.241326  ORF g.241326 m.241326 type:complete len:277 (+) comp13829_c0_seq1:144-974(+)